MQARDQSEEVANQLYHKLRLCPNSRRRQELVEVELKKDNGVEIIRNIIDLLTALIRVEQKSIWDKCCQVGEYPGNQEDVDTIKYIDDQIHNLKNGPEILLLNKLSSELVTLLNAQQQMFENSTYFRFDSLMQCQDLQEVSDRLNKLINDTNGAFILKSISELLQANMRVMKSSDNVEYKSYENINKLVVKALELACNKGNDEILYSPTLYQHKRSRRTESEEMLDENVKTKFHLFRLGFD